MAEIEIYKEDRRKELEAEDAQRRESYDLSPEELKFVLELIIDFDYERAYASVYELSPFFDESYSNGKRLLGDKRILNAVCQELNTQAKYLVITREMIALS